MNYIIIKWTIHLRLMECRFGMDEYNVCKVWEQNCENESDADKLNNCVSGEIGVSRLPLKKESINQLLTVYVLIEF